MITLDLVQGSDEWKKFRIGKVSGTRVGKATGSKYVQDSLIDTLIAEIITGEPESIYKSEAMSRGSELEDLAIIEFENKTGFKTESVGVCVHDKYDWLINSPDRLIKINGIYSEAAEAKVPNTETLVRYFRNGCLPKEYEGQALSYFLVNDNLRTLHFLAYDPRVIVPGKEMFYISIDRDDKLVEETMVKLLKFHERFEEELKKIL